MATNDKQVIFSLVNVGKVYPPKRQVLREIYLGFYYGAKIASSGSSRAWTRTTRGRSPARKATASGC